jgi:hypothetical protein
MRRSIELGNIEVEFPRDDGGCSMAQSGSTPRSNLTVAIQVSTAMCSEVVVEARSGERYHSRILLICFSDSERISVVLCDFEDIAAELQPRAHTTNDEPGCC